MESRKPFTRRFVFGVSLIVIFTVINAALFLYARGDIWRGRLSFVEKTDGTLLFGKVRLLDGGFVELSEVYTLIHSADLQRQSEGGEFRLESVNPDLVTVVRESGFDGVRYGPTEIKRWGDVSDDSQIGQYIINLMNQSKS